MHGLLLIYWGKTSFPISHPYHAPRIILHFSVEQPGKAAVDAAESPVAQQEHREAPQHKKILNATPAETPSNDLPDDVVDPYPIPDDYYFTSSEVTSHAYPIGQVPLISDCLESRHAVLKLWISETGQVDRIEGVKSDMDEQCLGLAMNAFRLTTFSPARRDQSPVKSIWLVEIHPKEPDSGGDKPQAVQNAGPQILPNSRP